jgi:Uma2 family endonuclease
MGTKVLESFEGPIRIPVWVCDLESFRRWARSDAFPERGRISYLNGELWVDLSMERLSHNQAKGIFAIVLGGLILADRLGRYLHDRMRLTNVAADLSSEPDGMFVSWQTLRSRRVRLAEGPDSLEVEGTPDMALEVVSPTSVEKDTELLPELYWRAGIPEYWLVDPRQDPVRFDIFRHARRGYVATRSRGGWLKSAVFGKSFRLTQRADEIGEAEFVLEVR